MRKPMLQKVRERVLSTLPLLPDADLAHIASVCDGLLRLRAQVKRDALGSGASPRPSSSVPQRLEQEESA